MIEPGSDAYVRTGNGLWGPTLWLVCVLRRTKTQIVVQGANGRERRFRKSDMREVGGRRSKLLKITPELKTQYQREHRSAKLCTLCRHVPQLGRAELMKLDPVKLQAAINALSAVLE